MIPKEIWIEKMHDFGGTLEDWKIMIESLIERYGKDAKLYGDAGPNNIMYCVVEGE
jgi:hypothetical protein